MANERLAALIANTDQVLIDSENEFDTYDLIRRARLSVTINSQSGLEAAIRGTPTVVCGQAFYGSLGFTYDASRAEHFGIAFSEAAAAKAEPSKTRLARKFTTIYFDRYCREKSIGSLLTLIKSTAKKCP